MNKFIQINGITEATLHAVRHWRYPVIQGARLASERCLSGWMWN